MERFDSELVSCEEHHFCYLSQTKVERRQVEESGATRREAVRFRWVMKSFAFRRWRLITLYYLMHSNTGFYKPSSYQ